MHTHLHAATRLQPRAHTHSHTSAQTRSRPHIHSHARSYRHPPSCFLKHTRAPSHGHARTHAHSPHAHSCTYREAVPQPASAPGSADGTGRRGPTVKSEDCFPICQAPFLLQKIITWAGFPGRWREKWEAHGSTESSENPHSGRRFQGHP